MATLAETAVTLFAKVKTLEAKLSPKLDEVQNACAKLSEAGSRVEESWSGSSLGYHSELHYGNFERPPLHARFDPEWGDFNGLPAGWKSRTPEEVKEQIERLAGVELSTLERETETVVSDAKALQAELVTELSALQVRSGLLKEKELLNAIEGFTWG